jgi:acyl-coenzyme A thioesterase PaaI-like protein
MTSIATDHLSSALCACRSTVGSVLFAKTCEGPPGSVHGGAIATALDDVLGSQVWRYAGYARRGMPTITLTVR